MARPASHWRTTIGSVRIAAMSASSNPETVLSRRNKAAKTNSRSKLASPPINDLSDLNETALPMPVPNKG
jgi:hypothetical protein